MGILDVDQLPGPVGLDWTRGEVQLLNAFKERTSVERLANLKALRKGKIAVQMSSVPTEALGRSSVKLSQ